MNRLLQLLRESIGKVPALTPLWGVIGICAAGLIILQLSRQQPIFAVGVFIFTFTAFLLVSEFLKRRKKVPIVFQIITGVATFCICVVLITETLGYVDSRFGGRLSDLVKVVPKSVQPLAQNTPTVTLPPDTISKVFKISDGSDDCGINTIRTAQVCLADNYKFTRGQISSPTSQGGNSQVIAINKDPNNPVCANVEYRLEGKGYENYPLGIKNCNGRGWLEQEVTIFGEK